MAGSILTASVFHQLGQYTSSSGRRGYCYAELAVLFPIGGRNITSTHCAYPRRDGLAELVWMADGHWANRLTNRNGIHAESQ